MGSDPPWSSLVAHWSFLSHCSPLPITPTGHRLSHFFFLCLRFLPTSPFAHSLSFLTPLKYLSLPWILPTFLQLVVNPYYRFLIFTNLKELDSTNIYWVSSMHNSIFVFQLCTYILFAWLSLSLFFLPAFFLYPLSLLWGLA